VEDLGTSSAVPSVFNRQSGARRSRLFTTLRPHALNHDAAHSGAPRPAATHHPFLHTSADYVVANGPTPSSRPDADGRRPRNGSVFFKAAADPRFIVAGAGCTARVNSDAQPHPPQFSIRIEGPWRVRTPTSQTSCGPSKGIVAGVAPRAKKKEIFGDGAAKWVRLRPPFLPFHRAPASEGSTSATCFQCCGNQVRFKRPRDAPPWATSAKVPPPWLRNPGSGNWSDPKRPREWCRPGEYDPEHWQGLRPSAWAVRSRNANGSSQGNPVPEALFYDKRPCAFLKQFDETPIDWLHQYTSDPASAADEPRDTPSFRDWSPSRTVDRVRPSLGPVAAPSLTSSSGRC